MAKSIMEMRKNLKFPDKKVMLPPSFINNHSMKKPLQVLHVSMEYGIPGNPGAIAVGGIASVVYSLCESQQTHNNLIDSRVIIPYYEGLHRDLSDFEEVNEIHHFYEKKIVRSIILMKKTDSGVIQYLVKPLDLLGINLFNDIHIPELIYSSGWNGSKFIERISYFSSAVAAFSRKGESSFKPDIIQGHGWATSFLGKLIRQQRIDTQSEKPYTLYVVHSIHDGDGVFLSNEVPDIGIIRNQDEEYIRLTKDILDNGFDHIVYVSEQLLKESILNPYYETISNFVFDAYKSGKTSAILNNISTDRFNPSKCLPENFKFNLNKIQEGKKKIKKHLNDTFLKSIGKAINLYAPMILYVGRYSDEKGIEKFDEAIKVILKNQGTFLSMGIGDPYLIQELINKYSNEKSVIFLTTKEEQKTYGNLIRSASDIFFIPSKIESCGLVPMEANVSGAIVIASRIGGLINVIVPDANGALFEFNNNLEEVLEKVLASYIELKKNGNLNIALKLIQESAVKSFDWNSIHSGSTFYYLNLYNQLGNAQSMEKRLIEQETIFTHALLKNDSKSIEYVLNKKNPLLLLPNKIGLTPLELASRMNRPDLIEKINEIIYQPTHEVAKKNVTKYRKKRVILHLCLEYKQVKFGGVGSVITSMIEAINHDKESNTECQVITPHYPWHSALIEENIIQIQKCYFIDHLYENKIIRSVVTKTYNNGTIQYLARPSCDSLYKELYGAIEKNESNMIFHNIVPKTTYINSLTAAFISYSNLKFNILISHGFGCSLTAKLLKEREKFFYTKTIQLVHAEITEQGVVMSDDPSFHLFHGMGVYFEQEYYISPLKEGILHSDKTVYVSENLLHQALNYLGFFHFNDLIREHYQKGKLLSILNGINDDFHPIKLFKDDNDLHSQNKISKNKFIAKIKTLDLISDSLSRSDISILEKQTFQNKDLNPHKNWTVFIGRFSEEKGIDRLPDAIECTLDNNGIFIVMGLYSGCPEDSIIDSLSEKYKYHPYVIILKEKNYNIQKKYGSMIRYASDITFIPSHRESAGLVSLEAQLNSSFVISSDTGGLNDSVIPFKTGFKYQNIEPYPYESMKKTITDGNQFISNLKNKNPEQYELLLNSLHKNSVENYLFSSKNGPIHKYISLFDSLCYFEPITKDNITKKINIKTDVKSIEKNEKSDLSIHFSTKKGDTISAFYETASEPSLRSIYHSKTMAIPEENFMLGKIEGSKANSEKIFQTFTLKIKHLNELTQDELNQTMDEFEILKKTNDLFLPYFHKTEFNELYFFLKPIKGIPFLDYIHVEEKISLSEKLSHILDLTYHLIELHKKNILHLNISEDSILIEPHQFIKNQSKARLIDFRQGKIIPKLNTCVKTNNCSPYSAPETFSGLASKKSDIYSLGIFIFKYLFYILEKRIIIDSYLPKNMVIFIKNFSFPENLSKDFSEKDLFILETSKNMIIRMLDENELSRLSLDTCSELIKQLLSISQSESLLPDFNFEEYCRINKFRSFEIDQIDILTNACKNNYFQIIKHILSNNSLKNFSLNSAINNLELLSVTIKNCSVNTIRLLLNHGFFNWINSTGISQLIQETLYTHSTKEELFCIFSIFLYTKEHGFFINDLNKYNHEGHTPISKLLSLGIWDEKSEFLLNGLVTYGANPNKKTLYGFDLIYFSEKVFKGVEKLKIIHKIFELGFILEENTQLFKEKYSNDFYLYLTAFYFIQKNNLSSNSSFNHCINSHHNALTLASENGSPLLIDRLIALYMQKNPNLNKKQILNIKNRKNETPLHVSILKNNLSLTEYLIKNDADLCIKDSFGRTAIDLLMSHHNTSGSDFILEKIKLYFSEKFYSASLNSLHEKLILYFQKRDFSAIYFSLKMNKDYFSPLDANNFLKSILIFHPTTNDFIALTELGIQLNSIDTTGESFLSWIKIQHPSLHRELYLNSIEHLKKLKFNLHNIEKTNDVGHTPLTYAVSIQNIELILFLIHFFKCDINFKNAFGNTPLHIAIDTKNVEIIRLLISIGADETIMNHNGFSAEDLSWSNEFYESIALLNQFKSTTESFTEQYLIDTEISQTEIKRNRLI